MKEIKLEKHFVGNVVQGEVQLTKNHSFAIPSTEQDLEDNRSSNALSANQSCSSALEQGQSPMADTGISSGSTICPAPLIRQFWKAGNYNDGTASKVILQNGKNYLHVHPMFLHSNATSHKWAFGAIAELIDNAVDEIQNGATYVSINETLNPRDGSPALLIQDDGGGMDPEAIRRCMSFGFSDKKSKFAIGQYGNGFKTSTMRLGADVIVFSRHLDDRGLTQSIGLLSYTFLTQTGHDRIVVPMVDYEFNTTKCNLEASNRYGKEQFMSNLSMLMQWSPYSTESELLKQFEDIGPHGTKVVIYNLWDNDDGNLELDFETDPQDIRIGGDIKKVVSTAASREVNERHIANRLQYSLRVYLSILYLRVPDTFKIKLRGVDVERHNLADDLKYPEYILYRPQSSGFIEGQVVTTIGFLKEAPNVSIHGFNIYHKNRLILPFWKVVNYADGRGRGVVGVLEANFIEPTHNKQDFERTSLFQKLEGRLKEMTWEYWDYHCGLIGYQVTKKVRALQPPKDSFPGMTRGGKTNQVPRNPTLAAVVSGKFNSAPVWGMKRKEHDLVGPPNMKRQAGTQSNAIVVGDGLETQPVLASNVMKDQEAVSLIQENKKLQAQYLEYEKRKKELDSKALQLREELEEVRRKYDQLMLEVTMLDDIKEEK